MYSGGTRHCRHRTSSQSRSDQRSRTTDWNLVVSMKPLNRHGHSQALESRAHRDDSKHVRGPLLANDGCIFYLKSKHKGTQTPTQTLASITHNTYPGKYTFQLGYHLREMCHPGQAKIYAETFTASTQNAKGDTSDVRRLSVHGREPIWRAAQEAAHDGWQVRGNPRWPVGVGSRLEEGLAATDKKKGGLSKIMDGLNRGSY
ncbi:hypothetical protein B0T17DRAFT_527885 [Bombardia bombarda]|uniref:Uncharacterized protein n=1 Tax=Bombardia bombarda TaxID=252184 RepID=A0AA39XA97_9PEZI|nr:hypothetical protein B0T17DRAFT_527885 [Bombardia bombarda]